MVMIMVIIKVIIIIKEENNLLTHLAVKGNPVEIHGACDLHSGK